MPNCGIVSMIPATRNTKKRRTRSSKLKFGKVTFNGLPTREELERQVGPLQLAKIAVIAKGEKVRLIHDTRRNGANSKVQLEERLVLPRLKDIVEGCHGLDGQQIK